MMKLLKFSALLMAAFLVFVMIGCGGGEEEEKDTTPPTLVSASPASGSELAANAAITLVFSEKMKSVNVPGGVVELGDGKNVTVKPSGEWTSGALTLNVTGEDMAGNALGATTLSYTVKAADKEPPKIASADPANGATGVDPAKVSEIKIVFSEAMKDAKVSAAEPSDLAAKISAEFDKNKTLIIKFLGGYKLSNEMEVKITLEGSDLAGNSLADTTYTFVTMKKEG